jgi:hypothetical protein
MMGVSCDISYGIFYNEEEGKTAAKKLYSQLQECFPFYYYTTVTKEKYSFLAYLGNQFSDGYEGAVLELFLYPDKSGAYVLTLRVNGGERTRYYTISNASVNSSFTNSVLKIYNDIPNNYASVKGKKYESNSAFSSSTRYDIVPMPDGAHDCSLYEGGFSLSNGCDCRYYLGADYEKALSAFNILAADLKSALGSEFTYVTSASELDMSIPKGTESMLRFGKKKERAYESLPLIALVLVKYDDGRYLVEILFYKFGM